MISGSSPRGSSGTHQERAASSNQGAAQAHRSCTRSPRTLPCQPWSVLANSNVGPVTACPFPSLIWALPRNCQPFSVCCQPNWASVCGDRANDAFNEAEPGSVAILASSHRNVPVNRIGCQSRQSPLRSKLARPLGKATGHGHHARFIPSARNSKVPRSRCDASAASSRSTTSRKRSPSAAGNAAVKAKRRPRSVCCRSR